MRSANINKKYFAGAVCMTVPVFMHTGTQRKNVRGTPLLDYKKVFPYSHECIIMDEIGFLGIGEKKCLRER